MTQIWKFQLKEHGIQSIEMPHGARVLSVQVQPNTGVMVWAECDPDNAKHVRWFNVVMTGQPFHASDWRFIATLQLHGGEIVLHVYERAEFTHA